MSQNELLKILFRALQWEWSSNLWYQIFCVVEKCLTYKCFIGVVIIVVVFVVSM